MIDQTGDVRGSESIVDVDDRHARGTTVEHPEKGGNSTKAGAIADAGGNGDHGHAHQTRYHTRERPLHAGHDDDGARSGKAMTLAKESVKASHADIINTLDGISHELGRNSGFFGNRLVGRSC